MRGRNRTKGPNPLTRSYESNGPDVKIRGTAQHVADKYAQLARDAHASGDPVSAENYYQHAEHYYRLIAAAQEQFRQQYGTTFPRPFGEDGDEDGDEEGGPGFGQGGDRNGAPYGEEMAEGYGAPQGQGYEPRAGDRQGYEPRGNGAGDRQGQPRFDRTNNNRNNNNNGQRFDRPNGGDRHDRGPNGYDRQGGGERYDRQTGERQAGDRQGGERHQAGDRQQAPDRQGGPNGERVNGPRNDRPEPRADRFPRNEYGARDGGPREAQPEREPRAERPDRVERPDRPDRPNRYERDGNRQHQPRAPESRFNAGAEDAPADNLPAFLTNPVMRPPVAPEPELDLVAPVMAGDGGPSDEAGARPARRRRTRKPVEAADDMDAVAAPEDAA